MLNDPEVVSKIEALEQFIGDPSAGLPYEIFLLMTRITPIVNVDLLIKDDGRRTLLTWRDDGLYAPGWHIPGGIVRYKESFHERVHAVAHLELGAAVQVTPNPLSVRELIHPSRKERGHFVSLLFACELTSTLDEGKQHHGGAPSPGNWKWHDRCPDNLLEVHGIYRQYF